MMKSSNTPRRVYVHKLIPVVCFNAKSYRAGDDSKVDRCSFSFCNVGIQRISQFVRMIEMSKKKKQTDVIALLPEEIHKLMAKGKYVCDTESAFQQKTVKVDHEVW